MTPKEFDSTKWDECLKTCIDGKVYDVAGVNYEKRTVDVFVLNSESNYELYTVPCEYCSFHLKISEIEN